VTVIISSRNVRVAGTGDKKNVYKVSVGKPEGKRPVGRPRRRRMITVKWVLEK
jgi:hypothetical protein